MITPGYEPGPITVWANTVTTRLVTTKADTFKYDRKSPLSSLQYEKLHQSTATMVANDYRQSSDNHSNGIHPCKHLVSWNLYRTTSTHQHS